MQVVNVDQIRNEPKLFMGKEYLPKESLPRLCIEFDEAADNLGACPLDCLAHCSTAAALEGLNPLASGANRFLRPPEAPSNPKSNSGKSLKSSNNM